MRAAGGLAILQIYDGGRIAKPELIGEQCLRAPSAVASLRPGAKTPRAMTANEVGSLIASFGEAASLARKAGFDGVEIHGANHYAVHQFFSPRANHRVDHWGGTLAKRMNFPLAVAQAVRDALGAKLIAGFRVTPFEAEADGYTLEDAKLLCHELARLDLDYISVSLDDYPGEKPNHGIRPRYSGPLCGHGKRRDQDVYGRRGGDQIGSRSGCGRTCRGGRSGVAFQSPKQERSIDPCGTAEG